MCIYCVYMQYVMYVHSSYIILVMLVADEPAHLSTSGNNLTVMVQDVSSWRDVQGTHQYAARAQQIVIIKSQRRMLLLFSTAYTDIIYM